MQNSNQNQENSGPGVDIQYNSSIVNSYTVLKYYSEITPDEELLSKKDTPVAEPLLVASPPERTPSGNEPKGKGVMDAGPPDDPWLYVVNEWQQGNTRCKFISMDWYKTDSVNVKITLVHEDQEQEVKISFSGLTKSLERRTADFNRMIEDRCGNREWYHSRRQDDYMYSLGCFQMDRGQGQGATLAQCMLVCKMVKLDQYDFTLHIGNMKWSGTSDSDVSARQKKMGIISRAYPIKSVKGGGIPASFIKFVQEMKNAK